MNNITRNDELKALLEFECECLMFRCKILETLISNMEKMLADWGFDIKEFYPEDEAFGCVVNVSIESFFDKNFVELTYLSDKEKGKLLATVVISGFDIECGVDFTKQDLSVSGYVYKESSDGLVAFDGEKWEKISNKDKKSVKSVIESLYNFV